MYRFMIESVHSPQQCDQVFHDLHAAGFLHHFDWGCKQDEHTGWAIIEAESAEHARQIVPWYLREKARVVKLVKFDLATDEHPKKAGV